MDFTRRWFAHNGTRYPNAFATTPLCCPSRSSIFTGRYAHNHGVEVNHAVPDLDASTTIQRHLKDQGYQTALVGKYLNRWSLDEGPPYFDRFSFFTPTTEERFEGDLYSNMELNIDGMRARIEQYPTHFMKGRALSYMVDFEEEDGRPWLMVVAPYAPQLPATAEPKYEDASVGPFPENPAQQEKNTSDKPDLFADSQHEEYDSVGPRQAQLRSLLSIDDMVSDFASALDCLGETNDTLAIFTSDNGYLWGEHGLRRKGTPYTEAVGVPLLVRWPDRGHPPIDDRVVANIDLAPTIAQVTGVPRDSVEYMDGQSLMSSSERRSLLLEFWPNRREDIPRWNAIRTQRYHYVEYEKEDGQILARELFDLKKDPWLLLNLLGDRDKKNDPSKQRLEILSRRLNTMAACEAASCR